MTLRGLQPLVALRGALSALAVGVVGLVVLYVVLALLMGDAGPNWDDPAGRAGIWLSVHAIILAAAGLGGAAGTWQAAAGGARTRGEAAVAGAGVPATLAALACLAADPALGGVTVALALGLGAALGAALLGRRLG